MKVKAIPGLLILLVAPVLVAQQFVNGRREAVPLTSGTDGTFLVDLDGDGALDIYFAANMYWHNDGHGRFTQRPVAVPFPFNSFGIATGDFDGDGDQDLVTTGNVLENRGALGPAWTAASLTNGWRPIAAADFNGDGKTDVVAGGGVAIAINLTTFQTIALGGGTGLGTDADAVADIDGDGDLDVVRASGGGTSPPPFGGTYFGNRYVWRNDGGGTWTVLFPFVGGTSFTDAVLDIVAFDADGDGDVDVGFLQKNSAWEFWRNTGGGAFIAWPGLIASGSPLEVCDLDHDGDADLVYSWGWFENRGLGSFLVHELPGSLFSLRAIPMTLHTIGDVNGDLQPDLVYGNFNPGSGAFPNGRRVMLNVGGAADFVEAGAPAWQSSLTRLLAIGDVDGDGFPDLVERSSIGGILWHNGGDGWFTARPGSPNVGQLVDLDGDGDLDGLAVTLPAVNDGTGTFIYLQPTPIVVPLSGQVQEPLVFDADGDGDNDLVYFNATTLVLMRNNGAWVYAAGTLVPLPTSGVTASAAADFDGDGDVDVLLGFQSPVAVGLLRNDGTGTFTLDPAGVVGLAGNAQISDLAVADLDGDGDRDVLVGRSLGTNPQHLVLRNSGGVLIADPTALPTHSAPTQTVGLGSTVRLGDVDGDGDQDAVVLIVPSGAPGLHLWLNDGTGHFALAEDLLMYWIDPVLLADVDLDGDADLIAGSRLFLSRQWHFEAPFLPQIGTTYVYRCASRALPNATAVTFLGTRIAPVQVPFIGGALCIDPQTAIEIGSLTLNGETAEGSVPVPLNSALIGLTASIQTVFLGVNGELHLAPAKHEIVRS